MQQGGMEMDFFSMETWSALVSIIIIDLILAGDNAVVIGMAARHIRKDIQKRVIIIGTMGAVVIRALAAFVIVWLLKIPGLLLTGGLLLVWIAYKLLTQKKKHQDVRTGQSIFEAIRTIIVADVVMGLDNVLAIAGAAQGSLLLILIGLAISVPIIIWGSTLIIRWIERYPVLLYVGAGVLVYTAGKMITGEALLAPFFTNAMVKWSVVILLIAVVLTAGRLKNRSVSAV
jgi:YjbE family integral membrane protein